MIWITSDGNNWHVNMAQYPLWGKSGTEVRSACGDKIIVKEQREGFLPAGGFCCGLCAIASIKSRADDVRSRLLAVCDEIGLIIDKCQT